MIVIGLTGQTGAGKTTVSEKLSGLGCAVISADGVAREAMKAGSPCLLKAAECFGEDIILPDGCCNRPLLAKRAFANRESTEKLNSITHPWIINRVREYIEELSHNNIRAIVFDAPQLYESGGDSLCDRVIAVTAPEDVRLERIISRDRISVRAAHQRMNAQHNEEYYSGRADYVIDGSRPLEEVREAAAEILEIISNEQL